MIGSAEGLIAFWDDISRGAANAIQEATKKGIKTKTIESNNFQIFPGKESKIPKLNSISVLELQEEYLYSK